MENNETSTNPTPGNEVVNSASQDAKNLVLLLWLGSIFLGLFRVC